MKKEIWLFISLFLVILSLQTAKAQKDSVPDNIYYPPTGEHKNAAIMFLGGAEGGLPDYYNIESYTSHGYPCFVVGYFNTANTPDRLELIPLEYFEEAIKIFKSRPEVGNKKIIVFGGSKGGELALLLASKFKEIEGVIAAVPGSVVFQGIGGRPVSSWLYQGEPVTFVPYAPYDFSKVVNNEYVEVYKLSLEQTAEVEKAAIKVENINGPVLLLTGKEDTMWPSSFMADMITERLDEKNFSHWYKHFAYDNAGHTLNDGYLMGGTIEGNKLARIDSQQKIWEFLNRFFN